MPKDPTSREAGINTLRAIAILMVVIYHATINPPPGSSVLYTEYIMVIIYIPLEIFTALAGNSMPGGGSSEPPSHPPSSSRQGACSCLSSP